MAKKKTAVEPQEEQDQAPAFSDEGSMAGDVAVDPVEGAAPEGGDAYGESAGFPAANDDLPYGDAPEGSAPAEPAGVDEMPLSGNAADGGDTESEPAMEDQDYADFLQAVKEGGEVEPAVPPEAAPLLLDEAADGDEEGGLSSIPERDVPSYGGEPVGQETVSNRIEDRRSAPRWERERILTVDPRAEIQTQEEREAIIWHELQNANRTRHILTGKLDSVGRTKNGMDVAVVLYKGVQVLIPLKEMMAHTGQVPNGPEYAVWVRQVTRILNARQNADIDFVVRGIDEDDRKVVGSRRDAMHRKRKRFYLDADELGRHMIEEGSTVQARVVAVADKSIRVEVFGVECNVTARGSSWLWVGSARENHYVGELILVRIRKIERINVDRITIQVDERSVFGGDGGDIYQCQPQCRYVGQVTYTHKGVTFVLLNNGVRAIAHDNNDIRMTGRNDTVSFTVTRLDENNRTVLGFINRIIKQNL